MEAHHNEVEPQTVEAVIVQAADALSGARPGARGESLEQYVKRLRDLEQIATRHDGVDKVYAMQAGREIRVMVRPGHARRRRRASCSATRSRARSSRSSSTRARSRSPSSGSRERPTTRVERRVKRFHVTTFGCQMNEHDSERMKGMLESLGYAEVPDARGRGSDPVQHLLDPREGRRALRPAPLRGAGAQAAGPGARDRRRRLLGAVGQGPGLPQFPFVDVAFGPGQVHKLAEFLTSESLTAQGFFEFEGFTGHLPGKRARDFQAWVQISAGCNMSCSFCIVPSTRGREVSRPFDELVDEVRDAGRRRRARGHAARPERQLLRHPPAAAAAQVLRAADGGRRDRRASTGSATPARTPPTCART